jgi:ubiquitin carboxyl-terminal hydrolase 5/13
VERAIDWIFSHADEIAAMDPINALTSICGAQQSSSSSAPLPAQTMCRDGSEKYRLVAFISHMGSSTMCGHYVCHILKEGKWVIFNDNKVALSESPPKELAYLYLYERI